MRAAVYILGASLITASLAAALSLLMWFAPGDYLHDLAALVNKRNLLASRPAPRLIFIGGSSLTTMRSPDIEIAINSNTRFGRAVVNLGLWGGLSMERYLGKIIPLLKTGDIVIISQEYATLLDRNYFRFIDENEEARRFFLLMSPGTTFSHLLFEGNVIDGVSDIIILNQLKVKTYLTVILESNFRHRFTGGCYRYEDHYNAFGNRIRPFRVIRPLNAGGTRFDGPLAGNLGYLKDFNDHSRGKGIRVFFAFPPFPEPDYRLNREPISALEILLREELRLELLNSPRDVVYPESCFADSVNHLTPSCEIRRSAALIRCLRSRIR